MHTKHLRRDRNRDGSTRRQTKHLRRDRNRTEAPEDRQNTCHEGQNTGRSYMQTKHLRRDRKRDGEHPKTDKLKLSGTRGPPPAARQKPERKHPKTYKQLRRKTRPTLVSIRKAWRCNNRLKRPIDLFSPSANLPRWGSLHYRQSKEPRLRQDRNRDGTCGETEIGTEAPEDRQNTCEDRQNTCDERQYTCEDRQNTGRSL